MDLKILSCPAFTLITVLVAGAGSFAAEPPTPSSVGWTGQSRAASAPEFDEATTLCLQLLKDPTNVTVMTRLRGLNAAVVKPMIVQLRALTDYWRTEEYLSNYVIRKSLTGVESRPDRAGVVTTVISVPPMTPGEMAIVFMSQRLSELGIVEVLPLLRTVLSTNEPIRVNARPQMDAAIARLAAQASTGKKVPPPALPPSRPAVSPAKPVEADRPPCGAFANGTYRNPAVGLGAVQLGPGWQHEQLTPRVLLFNGSGLLPCVPNMVGAWNRVEAVYAKASAGELMARGDIMVVGGGGGLYDLVSLNVNLYAHRSGMPLGEMMEFGVAEIERTAARRGYQGGPIDEWVANVGMVPVSFSLLKTSALMGSNLYSLVLQRYCNRTLTVLLATTGSEAVARGLPWGSMVQFAPCADQQPSTVPPSRFETSEASVALPNGGNRRVTPPSVQPNPGGAPPSRGVANPSATSTPAPPAAAPPTSDAWLSGSWSGLGRQGSNDYSVRLTVLRKDQLVGADVGYPSLNCSAKWTRQSGSERVVFFRQQVIQGNCLDSWVRLEWLDDRQALFSGHRSSADSAANANPMVMGTIRRER